MLERLGLVRVLVAHANGPLSLGCKPGDKEGEEGKIKSSRGDPLIPSRLRYQMGVRKLRDCAHGPSKLPWGSEPVCMLSYLPQG